MTSILDIDYLQSLNIEPKWFGLGFIQLRLSSKDRMHFWHPDLQPDDPAFNQEYHDHRYDFTSRVLVGKITNHVATVEPTADKTDWKLFNVCCSGGGQEFQHPVFITPSCEFTTTEGHEYFLHRDTFHRVTVSRCVTLQSRSEELKEKARVIQHRDHPSTNPFSSQMKLDDMWECISDLLPKKPGYHLSEIKKGTLGQPSKILEEAHELMDAFDQNSRVMELVELSDLLGAVEAFMVERHPGYTMEDLMTFSDITKRAFRNGRRS